MCGKSKYPWYFLANCDKWTSAATLSSKEHNDQDLRSLWYDGLVTLLVKLQRPAELVDKGEKNHE